MKVKNQVKDLNDIKDVGETNQVKNPNDIKGVDEINLVDQDILNDIEAIQNAIESDDIDILQDIETAAGNDSSDGSFSTVSISRDGNETLANSTFSTTGLKVPLISSDLSDEYSLNISDNDSIDVISIDSTSTTTLILTSTSNNEGEDAVHTITFSGVEDTEKEYTFNISNITTDSSDYGTPVFNNGVTLLNGVITVPANTESFTVTIPLTDDLIDESNETYNLEIGGTEGIGEIVDNDTVVISSINLTSESNEEGENAIHTVTFSGVADIEKEYDFNISDITTESSDYGTPVFNNGVILENGIITVPANTESFTVTIPLTDDLVDESDETYNLEIGGIEGLGEIIDNDTVVISSINLTSESNEEGENAVHTVTFSGVADIEKEYDFNISDITTESSDYGTPVFNNGVILENGIITVPANTESFTVTIPLTDDLVDESDETYNLEIGGIEGLGEIIDNDTVVISSINLTSESNEEGENAVHTVTFSGVADIEKEYDFNISDITTESSDYGTPVFNNGVILENGIITVPANTTSFTVTIPLTDDLVDESDETYNLEIGGETGLGEIIDNDTVVISSINLTSESNEEGENAVHTVTFSGVADIEKEYAFNISDITTESSDYGTPVFNNGVTLLNGVITVPANTESFTVTIPLTDDLVDESDETYNLEIGGIEGIGEIIDNDTVVISSIDLTSESNEEGENAVHTVTFSGVADIEKEYAFNISDITTESSDYGTPVFNNGVTLLNGVITVPANTESFTVTIPLTDDLVDESDETYNLEIGGIEGIGEIIDNDTVVISSIDLTSESNEEGENAVHTVTFSGVADIEKEYAFNISDITTESSDYGTPVFNNGVTLENGIITVPANTESFTVTIPLTDDLVDESDETYNLEIGGIEGLGEIIDNDTVVISSINLTSESNEEGENAVHTVTFSGVADIEKEYAFNISDITTESSDYGTPVFNNGVILENGIITVPANTTSFTVTIPLTDDLVDESDETYNLEIGGIEGVGEIIDNDTVVISSINLTSESNEEGENAVHTVTFSGVADIEKEYDFNISDITTESSDYGTPVFNNGVILENGIITVPANTESFTVTIPLTDDLVDESDETYNLEIGGIEGLGEIIDNDTVVISSINLTSESNEEGENAIHTVTFSGVADIEKEYAFNISDITTESSDYGTPVFNNGVILENGIITVPANTESFTVTIPLTDDLVDESDETYNLEIGGIEGLGEIIDNDTVVISSINLTSESNEEGENAVHTVTFSGVADIEKEYDFNISDITTESSDYGTPVFNNGVILENGIITVPANTTSFTVTIPLTDDLVDESDETYNLEIGGIEGVGEIIDNDTVVISSINLTSESNEEGENAVHTVTFSGVADIEKEYDFNISDITTESSDYGTPVFNNGVILENGIITVPANTESFTVTIPLTDDLVDESDETYNLEIGGIEGLGEIIDNDTVVISSINLTSESNEEGENAIHTVTFSGVADIEKEYAFNISDITTESSDYGTPVFNNGVILENGIITVPANTESFTVTIPLTDDLVDESDETYNLEIGGIEGLGEIIDNDTVVISSINLTSESNEEGENAVHTVTFSGVADIEKEYDFNISDITTESSDYGTPVFNNGVILENGIITVPANTTSFTVTIPLTDDLVDESDETYNLEIGGETGLGEIIDNDTVVISSINLTSESNEEGENAVHTVTFSGVADIEKEYAFNISDITTESSDYGTPVFNNGVILENGIITVPANTTSFTVTIPLTDDLVDESDETYNLEIGGIEGVGEIIDNDTVVISSINLTSESNEEGENAVHTVTFSGVADIEKEYDFNISDITTESSDYGTPVFNNGVILENGIITVPANTESFTVTIPLTDDLVDESDETYNLEIGGIEGLGEIIDNDTVVISSINLTSESNEEGENAVHTVTFSGVADIEKEYAFNISDITTESSDYGTPVFNNGVTLENGIITVPANTTSFTVTIPLTDDLVDESDETYNLEIGGIEGLGEIIDNDISTLPDYGNTNEDTVLNVVNGVLGNDSDLGNELLVSTFTVDGDNNIYSAGSTAIMNEGTLLLNSNGSYVFTPTENYSGEVPTITYITTSNFSNTLSLTVNPIADSLPDAELIIGEALPKSILDYETTGIYNNGTVIELENGIEILSSGAIHINKGLSIGIDGGTGSEDSNRIDVGEFITFNLPVNMKSVSTDIKNTFDDIIKLETKEISVPVTNGLIEISGTLSGAIFTGSNSLVTLIVYEDGIALENIPELTTTTFTQNASGDYDWNISYDVSNLNNITTDLIWEIDGSIFNNGGDTFDLTLDIGIESLTYMNGGTLQESNGYQINDISFGANQNFDCIYPLNINHTDLVDMDGSEYISLVNIIGLSEDSVIIIKNDDGSETSIYSTLNDDDIPIFVLPNSIFNEDGSLDNEMYLISELLDDNFSPTLLIKTTDTNTGNESSTIIGGSLGSELIGDSGNDYIKGNQEDDILIGSNGNDILIGGLGIDTFAWAEGETGIDHIEDFEIGNDLLDLSNLLNGETLETLDDFLNFAFDGDDTIIQIDSDGKINSTLFEVDQTIVLDGVDLRDEYIDLGSLVTNNFIIEGLRGDNSLVVMEESQYFPMYEDDLIT